MDVWLTYAYISNNKVVNTVCYLYNGYYEANKHAQDFCQNASAFAVEVTHIPVQIGDDYCDGTFYRGGAKIDPLPTVKQEIDSANEAIDDLIIAITPTEAN